MTTSTRRRTIYHWIDGKPHEELSTLRYGDIHDPATGEVTSRVAFASSELVDSAVQSAHAAFSDWKETAVLKRTQIIFAFRDLLIQHHDELAALITLEQGKILADASGELLRTRENVEMACAAPILLMGKHSDQLATGVDTYSLRQPLGVCVGITPFNFPAMLPIFMASVAIAAGNSFVLKPSEQDPSPSLYLADLWAKAGLPPGVFTVVQGDKTAVDALLDHPLVRAVSFIGSTPIAQYIYQRGAASGKRVQALGGAKNHMAVMPDADIDQAADALVSAAYGAAGQRCMAITTAVAVGSASDMLVKKARERLSRLRVGPGTDPHSDLGPLISQRAQQRVLGYIERGIAAGAELVADGREVHLAGYEEGYYIGPCLFDHVKPDMELYRDEIFGPVLIVVRVDTLDEAIKLIQNHPYGNGSSLFTQSGWAAKRFEREVNTGTVGINVPIPLPVPYYGFHGWKDSRFADHGINIEAFNFYTQQKVVTTRWQQPKSSM